MFALVIFFTLHMFSETVLAKPVKGISWNRHKHVKYVDINIAMNITKEVFYDFDISKFEATEKSYFIVKKVTPKEDKTLTKGTKLVFEPRSPGKTDLWVYDENGVLRFVHAVTVTALNYKRIYSYIRHELRNIEGLKIKWWEDKIILDGEILLPEDIARIHQVISLFNPSVFKIMYKLSPMLFKIVAKKMEHELANPNIHVNVINNKFVLTGFVYSPKELEEIQSKVALYLPKYIYTPKVGDPTGSGTLKQPSIGSDMVNFDLIKLVEKDEPSYLIKIAVYFVEVNREFGKNFGFEWAPVLNTSGTEAKFSWRSDKDTSTTATLTGIVSSFIPKLKSAVSNSQGRVIQSIATTVNEGEAATINKTTTIPYIVPGAAGAPSTVAQAQFGINMTITPTIIGADKKKSKNIRLDTSISVSQLMGKVNNIPITTSNSVQTKIDIKSGQAAAIGGVIQSLSNKAYGNAPSGEGDVIVNLSRSKDFQRKKTQFVIFILPKIIKDATEGSKKILKKFRME